MNIAKQKAFTPVKSPTRRGTPLAYLTGFTLIELLVVVSIIDILSTIVYIELKDAQAKSRFGRVKTDLNEIGKAVVAYSLVNNGDYPVNGNVTTLVSAGYLKDGWPTQPCDSAKYKYIWRVQYLPQSSYLPNCSGSRPSGSTTVYGANFYSVRGSTATYIYHYNVKDFNLCSLSSVGQDINSISYPDNKLTCDQ